MGYKTLSLTAISAKGLKSAKLIRKTGMYVAVSISGFPRSKKTTPVYTEGSCSSRANQTVEFTLDEAAAVDGNWSVVFRVMQRRTFRRDKAVGEVSFAVKDLLVSARVNQTATFHVRRPCGKVSGELEFSYAVSDAMVVQHPGMRGSHDDAFEREFEAGFIRGVPGGKMLFQYNNDGYYDPRAADYDF